MDRLYPGARIDPHFHDIDQFQVVVDGDCRMGKKAADPVTFQYADAYTPYGPIVGAELGFAFFTLRPIASGGFFPMPGNKHNMPVALAVILLAASIQADHALRRAQASLKRLWRISQTR